jgi:ADP-ribose pyrophosphatase YjhB (NUDIX family)
MIIDPDDINTFYRVSVKALIFDDMQRLLVYKDIYDEWELPGGGWEHGEMLEDCLRRELREELKLEIGAIGPVAAVYPNQHKSGYYKVCVAVPVKASVSSFKTYDEVLSEASFVTKEQFLRLPFALDEVGVLQHVDQIWALVEK